jgi:uncharacterized membrane protein HdeD (DUF308 family)
MENEKQSIKKKIVKNTKDPVTTILGIILALVGVAVCLFPDITSVPWYVGAGVGVVGILLVISPDTLIFGAKKGIDKYSK